MRLLLDTHALLWDPFDRMLIAQSQIEDVALVTDDEAFDEFDVRRYLVGASGRSQDSVSRLDGSFATGRGSS